jgi:hypothetical protein
LNFPITDEKREKYQENFCQRAEMALTPAFRLGERENLIGL